HRRLDLPACKKPGEVPELVRWDGERHALLRFGDPDLPRGHPGVLQGRPVELHVAAVALFCHLGHRAGEAAGAVVRDTPVQAEVPGLFYDHIRELLLGDRVPDLHRGDRALMVKGLGRERGAMDAIFSDPSAHHYDKVAGLRLFLKELPPFMRPGHHADSTGKDERLTCVPVIKPAEALRRRYPRAVAPHSDTPHDTVEDLPGGQDGAYTAPAPVQLRVCCRVADAEPVDIDTGLCTEAKADCVPVHPDDPGERPAKRVEG